jgi:hypothetical protein
MNYGEVLSRAWQIIWKHKALWIFGILAGCGSTSGGGGQGNLSYQFSGQDNMPPAMENFFRQFEQIPDWQIAPIVFIGILLVLLVVIVVVFLSTMGRIGMYRGTQLGDGGAERLSFGELFRGGLPYFWRVFLLNLLVGLVIFVVVLALTILGVLATAVTLGAFLICLIPLLCLAVPIGWLIGVWIEQSSIAIVVEDLGITAGLSRGWQVFRDNLATMILIGIILVIGVGLIGGIIIALPMVFAFAPLMVYAFGADQSQYGGWVVSGLCFLLYLPVLIVLSGILNGYIKSAWTLTFLRLTGKPAALTTVQPEPVVDVIG